MAKTNIQLKTTNTVKKIGEKSYNIRATGMHVQVFDENDNKVYDSKLSKKKLPEFWDTF